MNFDPLSFVIGKHGKFGPIRDVVSYLMGIAAGASEAVWRTITNVAIATFTAVPAELRKLVVDVTPVQAGSGAPSVDNVRLITGFTTCNLTMNDTTIQIIFPLELGTVYLGELNILTGILSVFGVFQEFDGTESWNIYSQAGQPTRKYFYCDLKGTSAESTDRNYILCSCYEYGNIYSQSTAIGARIAHRSASNKDSIFVRPVDVSAMNLTSFKEMLASLHSAGTPMQVVYRLLTPKVYQLTPTAVTTILGQNTVQANTGNINIITYRES